MGSGKEQKLREEIESLLATVASQGDFYGLVKEPLLMRGRALAEKRPEDKPWAVLPLLVCEAISAEYEPAIPVAAALELFRAAADVFDDIEDADSLDSLAAKHGTAKAINAATALLVLAERAIAGLEPRGMPGNSIVQIFDVINFKYTLACMGQHLDFLVGSGTNVSEEDYLKIAAMKSASALECACQAGALVAAGDNLPVIQNFAEWGHNLGMAYQLSDDINNLASGRDITYKRITLPVIFALRHTEGLARQRLFYSYSKDLSRADIVNTEEIRYLLFSSGAIEYASIKLEIYRNRARDILSCLSLAGINTENLKIFVE